MGTDNLHHKRKARKSNSLKRKIEKRDPYDLVLIVCEGSKTEPNYFRSLCDEYQLNTANIEIMPCKSGNDPLSIVGFSIEKFNGNKEKDYDRVYCVFDKDQHPNYLEALNKIKENYSKKKKSIPIYAINSVPCFEYWLLLHFEETLRPYKQSQPGSKSAGTQLKSELKRYIKDYDVGYKNIFGETKSNLNIAITRAKKIDKQQQKNNTDNPSTKVYLLAEYLMGIKK